MNEFVLSTLMFFGLVVPWILSIALLVALVRFLWRKGSK